MTEACCHWMRLWFVGMIACAPALRAGGQNQQVALPPGLERSISRGLGFLQKQQRPGGWFDAAGPVSATTSLALIAFLSAGNMPDAGKYGTTVRNAVNYLLTIDPDGGFLGKDANGNDRMYCHCIAMVALAQVHGTEADERQRRRVRSALEKGLGVLFSAQDVRKDPSAEGGWRYSTDHPDSDLSVTAWAVLALAACRDAGLEVPRQRMERALAYVLRCYRRTDGGFGYRPDEPASAPMTGAAVVCLHLLGGGARAEVAGALEYLAEHPLKPAQRFYYDSLYFVTLGGHLGGGRAGEVTRKTAFEQLLGAQRREEGSWPAKAGEPGGEGERGRVYSTAVSVMTLSIPLRLLPVYER